MTMRQWYAGQVMAAMSADRHLRYDGWAELVKDALAAADAMIAAEKANPMSPQPYDPEGNAGMDGVQDQYRARATAAEAKVAALTAEHAMVRAEFEASLDVIRENKEQVAALRAALEQARLQIVYLHEKFQETGSGNQVLAQIDAVLGEVQS